MKDCLDVVIEVKQKAAEVVQEVGVWWEESDLSKKLNETAQELSAAWENSAIGKTVAAIETQVNKAAEVISQKWNDSAIGQFANKAINAVTDFNEEHKTAINFIAGALVIGLCAVAVIATGPLGCCLMHTVAVGALKGALVGAAAGLASGAFGSAVSYYEENGTLDGSADEILEGASTGFVTGAFSGAASGGMDGGMKYIKNPKGFCFVAGTLVLTCLGFASIETIRPGDYVYSRNMATGAIEEQAVLDVYEREVYETYFITIGDEEIEATAEHPFYTLNDGWVAAEDLEIGDEVATADGESETVDDIVQNILDEPVTVYNFAVMDNHYYFVGENKLLVHNNCVKNPKVSESKLEKAIEKHAEKVKSAQTTELAVYDPEFAARQLLDGGTTSEEMLRKIIPKDVPNTFVPSDTIQEGFKFIFSINGKKMEIKWHSIDLNAKIKYPNSNSGSDWTAQIKVGKKLLGQDGAFYKKANNITHIPLKGGM